ncbi:MAG: hypothetical protein JNJ83_20300 [Verrucomicrobiaceae bacterium]|nr:hypothetical protein [Verrucomicrobiaceae bacterium]
MKHQLYFPARHADQLGWLIHFRQVLPRVAERLWPGVPAEERMHLERLGDLDWLIYMMGTLMAWLRSCSKAVMSMQRALLTGKAEGARELVLPSFEPPLPPGPGVRGGALKRVFQLVRAIKTAPGYTEEIGRELDIVGNLHAKRPVRPVFNLGASNDGARGVVRVRVKRFGHVGVWVETRRNGGAWEPLHGGVFTGRVVVDRRPLLDAATEETREYRMRFQDATGDLAGEWSPVLGLQVGPKLANQAPTRHDAGD